MNKLKIFYLLFIILPQNSKGFMIPIQKTNSFRTFKLTMNPGLRLFAFLSYKRCSGQLITDDVAFIAINDPVKRNKM